MSSWKFITSNAYFVDLGTRLNQALRLTESYDNKIILSGYLNELIDVLFLLMHEKNFQIDIPVFFMIIENL